MNKFFLIMVVFLITPYAWSLSPTQHVSLDCKRPQVQMKAGNYVLNTQGVYRRTQLYFLKNNSSSPILLNHPIKEASASAGWASELMPGRWSAIAVTKKNFELSCARVLNEKYQPVDCRHISVCQPPRGLFYNAHHGSFWLIENKSEQTFFEMLKQKRISIHPR